MKRVIATWMTFLLGAILSTAVCAGPVPPEPNATRVVISITVHVHPMLTSLAEAETFSNTQNRTPLGDSCDAAFGALGESGRQPGFRIDAANHYTCRLSASPGAMTNETGAHTLRFIPT